MSDLVASRLFSTDEYGPSAVGTNGTFARNHALTIHRWYPYLEGFSADFVVALLAEFGGKARTVHDPFAGAGTTPLVAASSGLDASYCEVNPFMRLVVEAKTNMASRASEDVTGIAERLHAVVTAAEDAIPTREEAEDELSAAFGDRAYFESGRLQEIVALRRAANKARALEPVSGHLAQLAVAGIVVKSSQLKRAGDVRYRRPNEMDQRIGSPLKGCRELVEQMVSDLKAWDHQSFGVVECLSQSALDAPAKEGAAELVITSPPYLNGTNYFRNTKLELWATGCLAHERELGKMRTDAVAAGINNISKRGRTPRDIPAVRSVVEQLQSVAYDGRIPELVLRYFSDAHCWLGNIRKTLKPGGFALIDIGGSKFAGVQVQTDRLLAEVAEQVGFRVRERRHVRMRRSNDGSPLEQSLLVLQGRSGE